MAEAQSLQPASVEIIRNIYDQRVLHAESLPTALAIGQRLVSALGLQPSLANLVPADFNPTSEHLSINYLDPTLDLPGWHDSGALLFNVSIFSIEKDGGQSIGTSGKALNHAIEAVEQAAEAPIQALPRLLAIKFATPEQTIAAAHQLEAINIEAAIEEQARRSTFAGMLVEITNVVSRLEGDNNREMLAYLEEYMPSSIREVATQPTNRSVSIDLRNLAISEYEKISDEAVHKHLIAGASKLLERLYARPEWESSYTFPHAYTFGPEKLRAPMSVNRLSAAVAWVGEPIDPRIKVEAKIRVDGTYDLRQHTFTTAERGRGASEIQFEIARMAISAAHTEREIGGALDVQMQRIGEGLISKEQFRAYQADTQQSAETPIIRRDPNLPPPNARVNRFSKLNSRIATPKP